MKYKLSLARLGRVGPVLGATMLVFAGSTLGFAVFMLFTGDFATSNPVESILRLVLAFASLVFARLMFKEYNLMTMAAWPFVLAVAHFVVVPSGLLLGSGSTWAELTDAFGASITGYEVFNTLIVLSLVLALIAAGVFRKKLVAQSTKNNLDKAVMEFWVLYKSRFQAAGAFTKLAGLALIVWAASEITLLLLGVSYGIVSISNGSWDALASLLIAGSFTYLTLRSGWKWVRVAWLVVAAGLWVFAISAQVLALSSPESGLASAYGYALLTPLVNIEIVAILVAIVSVLFVFVQMAIRAYASRVKLWIDKRIAELYKDEINKEGFDEPRTTSILAVFSLIFAFVLPIVGLILAHAARNEIAISKGAKFGTDMTIAAAVISWVFIGTSAVLVLALFVFLPLLDPYWLADLILGNSF